MITEHKNIKKFSLLLYIIGIVITIAASYCLKSDRLFIILLCCIEMGTTIYFIKRKDKNYLLQWTSIVVIFTLFFDVLLFTGENTEILMRGLELFACNVSFIISLVVLWKQKNKKSVYFDRILRENWYLLGIVLLFVIGCIPILDSWLGSGSYDYYSALQELNSWNYVDLSRFKLAGHQSQAFAFFLALGEFITPGNPVGARIMQIIMGISGILCFDLLIDKLFPGIKKSITIIALLLFSFSPLFFGLIGELNPDFAVLIFFMWFITSYAYKKYIFLIFSGFCLCLSKETGIIIYAAFVIEMCIRDSLKAALAGVEDKLILPEACENSDPSWFGFLITCKEGVDRNQVVQYVEDHGVQTRMLFAGNLIKHPCFDEMRASKEGYRVVGELKNTDRIMNDTFWVGVYPGMTDEMIDYMAKVLKEAVQ